MRIAVFLAALTIGLSFGIGLVASQYGERVGERFLERGTYTVSDLRTFVTNEPGRAKGYAFPVLFPCDFAYMMCLATFLGFASVSSADSGTSIEWLQWMKRLPWVFAIAPALFLASDLTEDILLARLRLTGNFWTRSGNFA